MILTLVEKKGDQSIVYFEVSPPKEISEGQLNPIIQIEEKTYDKELHMLDYKYIPLQHGDQIATCHVQLFDANYGPSRKGDVKDSLADITKAKRLLNYNPEFAVKEGIELTWKKFKG